MSLLFPGRNEREIILSRKGMMTRNSEFLSRDHEGTHDTFQTLFSLYQMETFHPRRMPTHLRLLT